MRRLALWTLAALVALALVHGAHQRGRALQCARASDGTDWSIAQCYVQRGLPVPSDL
jgi:hypothetical protein